MSVTGAPLEPAAQATLSLVPHLHAPGFVPGAFLSALACAPRLRDSSGMDQTDATLRAILARPRAVAVVGLSDDPLRASWFVGRYLSVRSWRVIGVNPRIAGQVLFGQPVRASFDDCPDDVDMVDIFRRSDAVPGIVEAALSRWPALGTIWMQIGVRHDGAAALARARGVTVVQDRCPKIEHQRLFGELRMGGFATGLISSRL